MVKDIDDPEPIIETENDDKLEKSIQDMKSVESENQDHINEEMEREESKIEPAGELSQTSDYEF